MISSIKFSQVEFAVQIPDSSVAKLLEKSLSGTDGIDSVRIYPKSDTVVIKSSLPISILQEKIESTGQRAVVKGYGGTEQGNL